MAQDPLNAAGNVYRPVMENDRVRVLRVKFKPGDRAETHHHPDHLAIALKGGKLELSSSEKTETVDLDVGQTVFMSARNHRAVNIGDTEIDLIVVELK